MCEGTEFAKQDGVFVCQSCGTKYSVEEAKKLMVEVEGETTPAAVVASAPTMQVAVQNTAQIDSLMKLAYSSFESKNYEQAENFCNQVIAIDDRHYEAWKLKGEAINWQITSSNPRILEAFNCVMTAYRSLDEDGKTAKKEEILKTVKSLLESEISFQLNQLDNDRPTEDKEEQVEATFNDVLGKVSSVFRELGIEEEADWYTSWLKNEFIKQANTKSVSLWKNTVGYNYYRGSFKANNHRLNLNYALDSRVVWQEEEYRPDESIRSTFVNECDTLIGLLEFATRWIDDKTEKQTIINLYNNLIHFQTHALSSKSFVRMVSTTTNGYGAVTERKEYWENDKVLADGAVSNRRKKIASYEEKLARLVPEEGEKLKIKQRIRDLEAERSRVSGEQSSAQGCSLFAGGAIGAIIGLILVLGENFSDTLKTIGWIIVVIMAIVLIAQSANSSSKKKRVQELGEEITSLQKKL